MGVYICVAACVTNVGSNVRQVHSVRDAPMCKTKRERKIRDYFFLSRKNTRWGSSNTPFTRWLPAEYEDKISLPIGWSPDMKVNRKLLPLVLLLYILYK